MGVTGDILAIALSIVAVGVSLSALLFSVRTDRVSRLTHTHETLSAPEIQEGRRLLWTHYRASTDWAEVKDRQPEEWAAINHALAMMDVAAYYDHKGWLPSGALLELWGDSLKGMRIPVFSFIEFRTLTEPGWERLDPRFLPDLQVAIRDAAATR